MNTSTPLLLTATLLAACGGGDMTEQPLGAAGFVPVAPVEPKSEEVAGYFLSLDGAESVEAAPGDTVSLQVTLFKFGGEPMPGGEVRFWLEDAPERARLMALTATTDSFGVARTEVRVGDEEGAFRFGCNADLADDLYVDVAIKAEVAPEPEPVRIPDVQGTYDLESTWDLTSRMGGTGDTIRQFGNAFSNPGRFLAEFIQIDGIVGSVIQGIVEQLINDLVISRSPQWLQGSLTIGDDILSLLTDLKVRSELVVAKVQPGDPDAVAGEPSASPAQWEGTHTWKAIRYEWDMGCPAGVEGCGDKELLLPADATAHAIVGSATLDGAIAIHEHDMDVPVAPLALRLITEVVLPARTGHTSFASMLDELVSCDDFGRSGERAVGIPFTSRLIASGCRAGLERAAEALERKIADAIHIDMGLVEGQATAMDTDRDGDFDKWGAGSWTGVEGRFSAARR